MSETVDTGIIPKGDYVLLRLLAAPNRTASGIIIPDGARNESIGRGLVVAVGPDCKRCAALDVAVIGEARYFVIMGKGPLDVPKQYVLLREEGIIATEPGFVETVTATGEDGKPPLVVLQ